MDTFTVGTACVGTIAAITQLVSQITSFVLHFKDAHAHTKADRKAVMAQLKPLQKSLNQLQDKSTKLDYPKDLRQRLIDMVQNCGKDIASMQRVLDEVPNDETSRRLQWILTGQDDVAKLNRRLESHKTAVALAVAIDVPDLPPTGRAEPDPSRAMFIHYTISEDRSGDQESVLSARLAALGTRSQDARFSNPSLALLGRRGGLG